MKEAMKPEWPAQNRIKLHGERYRVKAHILDVNISKLRDNESPMRGQRIRQIRDSILLSAGASFDTSRSLFLEPPSIRAPFWSGGR
jgi:hypothetical protein